MDKEILQSIARTAMDGVKDAQMQYEYAEKAAEHGNHEAAMFHIEEAKRRLEGAKTWYDRGMKMHGDHVDPLADMMMDHYRAWYRDLHERITNLKPGA